MYSERLRTLSRAYAAAERNNKLYNDAKLNQSLKLGQVEFLLGTQEQLKALDLAITKQESDWRSGVLSVLEAEITKDLAFVYPADGYSVKLHSKVVRGKVHISASVQSTFSSDLPGRIQKTQGRLFQQIVSFSAMIGVMSLLGIKTVYMDEAFSCASKRNIDKLNALLSSLDERGYTLIVIAQDTSMAEGLDANRLFLSRSIDNKTTVVQGVRVAHGE